jgi:hypothetical protein
VKKRKFEKCLDKNGYLMPKYFDYVIRNGLGGWQLGGICPFCNKWQLAMVRCEDRNEYEKTFDKIKKEKN